MTSLQKFGALNSKIWIKDYTLYVVLNSCTFILQTGTCEENGDNKEHSRSYKSTKLV
jgi:hypothetical protein